MMADEMEFRTAGISSDRVSLEGIKLSMPNGVTVAHIKMYGNVFAD